jgi:hypothetical protein
MKTRWNTGNESKHTGRGIETWKAIVVRYTTALGRGEEESLLL